MPKPDQEFVSVYANGTSGTVVTVAAAWADDPAVTVLPDEPAVDKWGVPLPPRKATTKPAAKKAAASQGSKPRKPRKPRARKSTSKRASKKSATSTNESSSTSNGGTTQTVAASTPEEASK